jgi:hypothetical protein
VRHQQAEAAALAPDLDDVAVADRLGLELAVCGFVAFYAR